jgi:hypothetical protein
MRADIEGIKQFYRRLNHCGYGVTELAVIDPNGEKGVIATGFFNDEEAFIEACNQYDGRYNIYAGRNPRPLWLPKVCENHLDTRYRQRARDKDIECITAISLDIDPIRPKGTSSTEEQHKMAIEFTIMVQRDIGGWVDDSGNGAYLWLPFKTPIIVDNESRDKIKQQCRIWQSDVIRRYKPQRYNLRIDGCFDLSRLKKVIGTVSVKGSVHRLSKFVIIDNPDDKVRDEILSLCIQTDHSLPRVIPSERIPERFVRLLKANRTIKDLWVTPNGDRSSHDWMLGCELAKEGLKPNEIASILMINPFGKYQRDRRYDYIQSTMRNLMNKN